MYQKIIIVGNLGNDPELRYTPTGQAICNFNVASNRRWTNQNTGEAQEETTWFRVAAWGKLGENVNTYLEKGRQVMIEGRLVPDPKSGGPKIWHTNDGEPRANYEVVALEIRFLGGGGPGSGDRIPAGPPAGNQEDEIPF